MVPASVVYIAALAAMIIIIYQQTQIDERDRLLHYYRQPGYEHTACRTPSLARGSTSVRVWWCAEEGKLSFETKTCQEIVVYVPEEIDVWLDLDPEEAGVREIYLYGLIGEPRVLFKWRFKHELVLSQE